MRDMREALKHGDKTTTGGVLISSVLGCSHHGVAVGQEGDYATCPACKAGGPVINDAHPAFMLQSGKQILVRGARVMCQCADKPLVIPSQHDFTIEVNRQGANTSAVNTSYSRDLAGNDANAEIIEQYYEILGEDGQPVDGYRYDLFSDKEPYIRNGAMAGGRTISVAGEHYLRIVMWLDKKGQACA